MGSFLKTASKQVSNVNNFLRESAGGNSIKYASEKGAKHVMYIPYITQEVIDEATGVASLAKQICAISGHVHEWQTSDGKFKAVCCLKDVVRKADDGVTVINDGSCPFCNRITAGWDVYNYRKLIEEDTCKLTGEKRKTHLETVLSQYRDERKAKDPRNYMYVLAIKFRMNESGTAVMGTDGLPEYDIKVMKLSSSRVEKLQQQVMNSGSELAGSELIFEYPNLEDRRALVSQSTTTPVFPNNQLTAKYPKVLDKINEDVAKFDWEVIPKSFTEWDGMSVMEAQSITDSMFEQWDSYTKELTINPQAKYLEYTIETPDAKPDLAGALPGMPTIPVVPTAQVGAAPVIPAIPVVPTAPAVPNIPVVPDVNGVFAGSDGQAPTINM